MGNERIELALTVDAEIVCGMQKLAFAPLLKRYEDYDVNPAMETVERVREKMAFPGMDTYLFLLDGEPVGSVRVFARGENVYKIAALYVLPEYQGRGIAQQAMALVERQYPNAQKWVLDTILEEAGNCHLYEKLGYIRTGEPRRHNERMTLVDYEKKIAPR